ncbi:VWA domain-containing protein [Candidatus Liberibacter asiaticus]|uniref:VWFA domain-containing protein n=2 Tax=Liberibacter asiaticus TaxID=34021 RepID=C6XG03_LIBAP|nr:VWA domain-containing protein [Candidatus Liberibacter asiaticus]ACT57306.1 hypothetical protein CLIBASIA_03630 [Candidatus Liberibacter asiaticus str. psy62]AGH17072.1 hypothetical protein WSI_03510 [Candidatus Liberibacter asiaticus str. gxpsy]ALK07395.1 VWA domain-containing protein [Candidatus Liberibacter asiaticus]ASK52886.1 hypothetical protein B2I23_03615 [Candidatus Liberibacter asiaticus]AWL14204.1 VWA domain-containing protein [Candidatus Liberibacter asiaticus]
MSFLNIRNFFYNCKGSISILTAILLPVIFIVMGLVIETSHKFFVKAKLHYILDHSLLYTATKILNQENGNNGKKQKNDFSYRIIKNIWQTDFRNELRENGFAQDINNIERSTSLSIIIDDQHKDYNLSAVSRYEMPFIFCTFPWCANSSHAPLLITSSVKISSKSDIGLDMMMVLDVSLSMNDHFGPGMDKLGVATRSIREMLDIIKSIPDVNNVVRSGLVTFSSKIVQTFPLAWGVQHIQEKINRLIFGSTTKSTPGLEYAYNKIFDAKEKLEHIAKGHDDYKKYIIFLTDGENSSPNIDNKESLFYCNEAKRRGAIVYAIGVQAEAADQFLKNCASPDRFYSVQNSRKLHDAFLRIGKEMVKQRILYNK